MNIGDTSITRVYLGDTQLFKVYLGANVIFTDGAFSWNLTSLVGGVEATWAFTNNFNVSDTATHVTVDWV